MIVKYPLHCAPCSRYYACECLIQGRLKGNELVIRRLLIEDSCRPVCDSP